MTSNFAMALRGSWHSARRALTRLIHGLLSLTRALFVLGGIALLWLLLILIAMNEEKVYRGWTYGFCEPTGSKIVEVCRGWPGCSTEYCVRVEGAYCDAKELVDTNAPPVSFEFLEICFDGKFEAEVKEPELV